MFSTTFLHVPRTISFQAVHFEIFCAQQRVRRSFSSYSVNWNAELGVFCRSQMQKSDANASPDLFFFAYTVEAILVCVMMHHIF